MGEPAVLQDYRRLEQLSRQMLDAARGGRWEQLIAFDQERLAIVGTLRGKGGVDAVPAEAAPEVMATITAILKMDEETQSLAATWRDELQSLLGSMSVERKLLKTYGT